MKILLVLGLLTCGQTQRDKQTKTNLTNHIGNCECAKRTEVTVVAKVVFEAERDTIEVIYG
jgi:hypothetical protein